MLISFTAFLAEPIRNYFIQRANRRSLHAALYREMAHLYTGWKGLIDLIEEGKVGPGELIQNMRIASRTDCYAYAKTKPVDYYALPEAATIDALYRNFMLVGDLHREGAEAEVCFKFARAALNVFEINLRRKTIDSALMLSLADEVQREMLRKVLDPTAA